MEQRSKDEVEELVRIIEENADKFLGKRNEEYVMSPSNLADIIIANGYRKGTHEQALRPLDFNKVLECLQEDHPHIVNRMLAESICAKFGQEPARKPVKTDARKELIEAKQRLWQVFRNSTLWDACVLEAYEGDVDDLIENILFAGFMPTAGK